MYRTRMCQSFDGRGTLVHAERPVEEGERTYKALARFGGAKLDVEADVRSLARHDEDRAGVLAVDCALEANVGEVGEADCIHDAPDGIGGLALERDAELLAHPRARAVAPDDKLGANGFLLAGASVGTACSGAVHCVGFVVAQEVATVQAIRHCADLRWRRLLLGEMPQGEGDRV